ncbi:hypothetical protein XOCgx_1173 [Xanthomonas oryzae pv. oryzicola]|nr:hypothetical protein XOCgx_1173 [Xanthomonas oryzae pv. oryzicola]
MWRCRARGERSTRGRIVGQRPDPANAQPAQHRQLTAAMASRWRAMCGTS